jgi:hypothetical protein
MFSWGSRKRSGVKSGVKSGKLLLLLLLLLLLPAQQRAIDRTPACHAGKAEEEQVCIVEEARQCRSSCMSTRQILKHKDLERSGGEDPTRIFRR